MKIFNAEQIRACDAQTIRENAITSVEIMEKAAKSCFSWIRERYPKPQSFLVVCGMGNNGGDGLALTRLLIKNGYRAKAIILKFTPEFSEDADSNFKRLEELFPQNISIVEESGASISIAPNDILIDAVFGTGVNRPVKGWLGQIFSKFNHIDNEKIAIDMPSGLPTDRLPETDSVTFKVDKTLSFQFCKRVFLHREAASFTGQLHILDIGLSQNFMANETTTINTISKEFISSLYRPRQRFSHKGDFGTVQLVGGSYGMIGALSLATKAALRSGVGKVRVQGPDCGYAILQTLCPEAIFKNTGETFIENIATEKTHTFGLGPGLGTATLTQRALRYFMQEIDQPIILDADALNIMALNQEEYWPLIPKNSILTPHPGEFKRLFGDTENSLSQVELGMEKAQEHQLIIVLKGHHTAILLPNGKCFYNTNGNSGMAKGGSGDVLTGIITGLLAQGYSSENAAIMGVWLHGQAGNFAAKVKTKEAMTAGDIANFLPEAFKSI